MNVKPADSRVVLFWIPQHVKVLFGCESKGVPDEVHDAATLRVLIPMRPGLRSLNVAVSAGIALSEALRQTNGYPTA